RLTNRTPSAANSDLDAVVKSVHLVPIPMTTSASAARAFAAAVPVAPMPPPDAGWAYLRAPFAPLRPAGPAAAGSGAGALRACRPPPPDAAPRRGMVVPECSLARLRLGDRYARRLDELPQ